MLSLAPCVTPTIPNARFYWGKRLLIAGELIKHNSQIELICDNGFEQSNILINDTLSCSFGSWDSFSSEQICLPKSCHLPSITLINGNYLDLERNDTILDHNQIVHYECSTLDFGTNQTINEEIHCLFGELIYDSFGCFAKTLNQSKSLERVRGQCRSRDKIENALYYFNELFNEHLNVQSDRNRINNHNSTLDFDNLNNDSDQSLMPFEYEQGTEIVFRCISYKQKQSEHNQTKSSKSTWVIRCENGNWIGRSFDCG